jgi:glycosyltransferase involved in cell wall biosynthesis
MRLAIVMSHANRSMGGAVRDTMLARALNRHGVDARLWRIHAGTETEREAMLDGAVQASFCPSDNPQAIPHHQTSAALKAELREFAPDVVLYKGMGYRVNVDTQAALPAATRHGFIVGGGVTDPLLDGAAIVLGEYREQILRSFPAHCAAERAMVLPKYVDFAQAGRGRPVAAEAATYDIVNVGTFAEKRKNQGALLPMAAQHRIALVGAGPLMPPMRRGVPARMKERVSFLGRLPHPQVFEVLRQSRIMVHSSTMDGLPRATIEAMACGVPVVALRSTIDGGIPHGVAGLLVSDAALPHAAEMLLADDELRIRMGRNARRFVERHHGEKAIEASAAEVLKILG